MLFPKRQQSIILSQTYWITLNKLLAKKVIVGTHRKGSLSKLIGIFNIKLKIQYRIQKFISLLSQHLFWICKITERELLKLCVIMSQIYFTYFSLIKDLHVVQVARGLYNEMIAGVVVKTLKSQLWLVGTEQVKTRLDHCPLSTSGNVWLVNFWGGQGDSGIALARFGTCRSQEFSYTSTEGQFLHSFPVTRLLRVPTPQAAALFLFFNPPTTLNPCLQKEANWRLVPSSLKLSCEWTPSLLQTLVSQHFGICASGKTKLLWNARISGVHKRWDRHLYPSDTISHSHILIHYNFFFFEWGLLMYEVKTVLMSRKKYSCKWSLRSNEEDFK